MKARKAAFFAGAVLSLATLVAAQQVDSHQHSDAHHRGVQERGEQRMGFDQQATTHHFVLLGDGGLVRVQARQKGDTAAIAQIRSHLKEIRQKFSNGDFEAPEFIHSQKAPGVPVMRERKGEIRYSYHAIERGAELRMTAKNAETVAAIHDFLKFQITDHQTGDPLQVRK